MSEKTVTLTTGELITLGTPNYFMAAQVDQVHRALDKLVEDQLYTHQLPRALSHVGPRLREVYPWLEKLELKKPPEDMPSEDKERFVLDQVDTVSEEHGELHTLPIMSEGWEHLDPVQEMLEIMEGRFNL